MGGVIERQYAAACLTAGPAIALRSHSLSIKNFPSIHLLSPFTTPSLFIVPSASSSPTVLAANLIMIDIINLDRYKQSRPRPFKG
jgi:hypothetical protein